MSRTSLVSEASQRFDDVVRRAGPHGLRIGAGLLWLSNVSWKVPPDFGRTEGGCRGLCGYVSAGSEFPVLPGSAWFFREIVSPNLGAFGWFTLISEAVLAALLLSGRYLRVAGVLGVATSFGILASVANAEHEWYWSYLLMIFVHLAVLLTAETAARPTARAGGLLVAAYGVVVAAAHSGAPFVGDGNGTWRLFAAANDVPGDFGRNVFPGSMALGLVLVALGVAVAVGVTRLDEPAQRATGWTLVGVGGVLLVTYGADGTVIGLGSRASSAAVVAALGLVTAVRTEREPDTARVSTMFTATSPPLRTEAT